ncbi:MAG: TetR/AcrR family transcriptional regulator [Pseudomonadota bacterium]
MTRKKADQQKNTTKIHTSLIDAALRLAAAKPWEFVSTYEIAMNAGVSLEQLEDIFPNKHMILEDIVRRLDSDVEQSFSELDEKSSSRDRLFDVLMERFEMANQHRAAHVSFFKSLGWTKTESCNDVAMMRSSMTRMAKLAGIDVSLPLGPLRIIGLSALYSWVLLAWIKDDSPDLIRTMAQLDKSLGYAEKVLNYVGLK